jgi:hypothetical protein
MAQIRPRYEVHKLDGKVDRTITKQLVDDDGKPTGGFETEVIKEEAGWMVYFPAGSSIRIRTQAEMERLGFDKPPELVDMESGDVVGSTGTTSLKARVEQKTSRGRKTRPSVQQTGDNGV